jgi:hypothetical protein
MPNANPQVALGPVSGIIDTAQSTVTSQHSSALAAAEAAVATANSFLDGLTNIENPDYVQFNPTMSYGSGYKRRDIEIPYPDIDPYIPLDPNVPRPDFDDVSIDIGNPPVFDIAPIVLTIPDFPELEFPDLTETRPVVRDVTLPSEPDLDIPEVPTLQLVTFPDPITIDFPTFNAILPPDNIVLPVTTLDPGILEYDSPILQMLKDKILYWITTSGTGLDPDIEQDIYDRNLERDELAQETAMQTVADEWSKRGFVLPNGMLNAAFLDLQRTYRDKRLDVSRDIAIKQAELAQQNTHFYIEKALGLEVALIDWTNKIGMRTFEASKFLMEYGINTTKLDIERYNLKIEIYKTQASIYSEKIKGELAKVEVYKAMLDASRLISETNKNAVEVYKTRIEAMNELINMYLAQIKAAMSTLEVDKAKIDCYKALVETYIAQINAITAKYGAYKSRMDGERAKADIYGSEVDAFKSKVEAYKAEVDALTKGAESIIEKNKLEVQLYSVDVEAKKMAGQLLADHAKADADVFIAHVNAYKAHSEAEIAQSLSDIKAAEMQIESSIRIADGLRNAQEANMKGFIAMEQLRVEAAKGGAQVSAQMASGAFSSINVSAQLQAHGSAQQSFVGTESISDQYTYEMQTTE